MQLVIPQAYKGLRLDHGLARLFPEHSRGKWCQQIKSGQLCVEGEVVVKPSFLLQGGEQVRCPAIAPTILQDKPEPIALEIVYEDAALMVINKPSGLSVHPGAGQPTGTLLNALLHYVPALEALPRAGIVHRLDKETTGLLLVAKDPLAYQRLVAALAARRIKRVYEALVYGRVGVKEGVIEASIGRDPKLRTKMAVLAPTAPSAKPAKTHYQVLAQSLAFSHLRVALETGRTHQIRVHLAHIQHPLVGDPVYKSAALQSTSLKRQALHARSLGLVHPFTQQWLAFESALPHDMQEALQECSL